MTMDSKSAVLLLSMRVVQPSLLQTRLGAGDYDAAAVRVLHMVVNPETEVARLEQEQAVERLEAENKALKDNIARLEGGWYCARLVQLDYSLVD
jgi:cell division protein FtsB